MADVFINGVPQKGRIWFTRRGNTGTLSIEKVQLEPMGSAADAEKQGQVPLQPKPITSLGSKGPGNLGPKGLINPGPLSVAQEGGSPPPEVSKPPEGK